MSKILLALVAMILLSIPVHAQPVSFCEKGWVCWTDGSGGKAQTELKIRTDGPDMMKMIAAGVTRFDLRDVLKDSRSEWLCVHARQVYPDWTVSAWYISETEGVCDAMSAVLTPVVVPPPVMPPPIVPPPIPVPTSPLTNVTVTGNSLTFDYKTADCPKGIQMQSGKIVSGKRTVTMTCRK